MPAVYSNKKLIPCFEISHDSSQQVFINQSDYRYTSEPIIHWAIRLSRSRLFHILDNSYFYCKTRECDPFFLSHYLIVLMRFHSIKTGVFGRNRNCHFAEFNGNHTNGTMTFNIGEYNDVQRAAYPLLLTWHVLGNNVFLNNAHLNDVRFFWGYFTFKNTRKYKLR